MHDTAAALHRTLDAPRLDLADHGFPPELRDRVGAWLRDRLAGAAAAAQRLAALTYPTGPIRSNAW